MNGDKKDLFMWLTGCLTVLGICYLLQNCKVQNIDIACDINKIECRDFLRTLKGDK